MNWPEEDETVPPDEEPEAEAAPAFANALFLGDSGELPLDTRRALVQLLAGPSLDGCRHPKLWPILVRDKVLICRRLAEFFLELVIDPDVQVAFTRQADTGDLEVPLLLRRAQLSFIESILLLYLRQRLTQADAQGDRAVVSSDEILEFLTLYERASSTDRAGFARRVHAAIEKIKTHSILRKIRSSDDRFEISPTLKLLFSAEKIEALTRLYQRMAAGEVPVRETPSESGEEYEE
ncbi:MAG: DUF4194 domain-containing protein [Zoogloeaceae bacterium]|jgi:hypothetical protein|nr:DUF4194 domain-containing protein [Zoogloeaceae bacterium]